MSSNEEPTSPPPAAQGSPSLARALGRMVGRLRRLGSLPWEWEARLRGAELRGPVVFLGRPVLTLAPGSSIVFHGGNEFFSSPRCNALGNARPCVLRTLLPGASIEIGRGAGLSSTTLCAVSSIHIGEGTIFGSGAMVLDSDLHRPAGEFGWADVQPDDGLPVRIGRGCFIGAGALILKGVTLGDRVVVGAGAVVTKDVPAGGVAVGNPARVVSGKILSG